MHIGRRNTSQRSFLSPENSMIPRSAHVLVSFVFLALASCFPDPKLLDDLDDLRSEVTAPKPDVSGAEVDTTSVDVPEGDVIVPECGGPTDCPAPSNQCQTATCKDGKCGFEDRGDTICDDLNPCTTDDKCASGACAGTAKACDAPDACHRVGTCEATTGVCVYPVETNGTACDDGDRCTAGDACLEGECKPTRAKNDWFSDWVQLLPSTATAQLAGLKIVPTGFVALVNFQRIGEQEARIGNGGQTVYLPEGSNEGVALLEFTTTGTPLRSVLVASSADRVRGTDISVLDNNRLMVAGNVMGTAYVNSQITLTSKANQVAHFGLRFQGFQLNAEYWLIESDTQESGRAVYGVFGAGNDCVAIAHIQAGRTATLSNQRGLVTQIDAPESAFSAVWIVWIPGCLSIAGAERLATASGDGGVYVTSVSRDREGGLSLAGLTSNGLVIGAPGSTGDIVFEGAGFRGFAFRLNRDRLLTERLVLKEEGEGAIPFVRGVAHADGGLWASFDVGMRAFIGADETSLSPVPGNPVADNYQGRAVVAQIQGDGTATVNVAAFPEYSGKQASLVGVVVATPSGRLVTAPVSDGQGRLDAPSSEIFGLRSIVNGIELWTARIFEPGAEPSASFGTSGPVHIDIVPASEGVIAGGTVSGTGKVGPPTKTRIFFQTNEEVEAVYFIRANSDDGYGCPTAR